jgi:hypothetical protein
MTLARIAPLVLAAALSTGCLRMSFVVNVKPDGSGTIVQTMALSKAAMKSAGAAFAAALEIKETPAEGMGGIPLLKEDELKAAAESMGVRYVGLKTLNDADFEGQIATFAFDDIGTLPLSLAAMFGAMSEKLPADLKGEDGIGLRFTRESGRSVLVLTMPDVSEDVARKSDERAASAARQTAAAPDLPPEMIKMVQDMFTGFSIEAAINVEGAIVSTNAPYVDGTKITLLHMDFGELLKNVKDLEKMMATLDQPGTKVEDMLKMPGLKIVTQREVRIEFR